MALNKLINKSFAQRTVSGILLVLIALITLIIGNDVLLGFCFLISIIGLYELYHVMNFEHTLLAYTGYFGAIVYYIIVRFNYEEYQLMYFVIMLMIFLSIFVLQFSNYQANQIFLAYFGLIYIVVMISFLYKVRMQTEGVYLVWLILLCSWGCDTFAYLIGVLFGKHKLAPVLSPKKSIEGSIGGIIGAAVLGIAYATIFKNSLISISNPVLSIGIICAIGAVISQIGDLAASGIKRNYNVKDYGNLIPGHGGVLDRFDSIIFTAPIIYFLTLYI